jgi:hypothetical protein
LIPIAFVQSLASIEGIEKNLPLLKPVIEMWVSFHHNALSLSCKIPFLEITDCFFFFMQRIYQISCPRISTWDCTETLSHLPADSIDNDV